MSIDKFGRTLQNEENYGKFVQTGQGIPISLDGNYDVQHKRIENLADPVYVKDAVNSDYVLGKVKSCLRLKVGGFYDARHNNIRRVKDPVENDDAVTKQYLESLIPKKLSTGYSLENFRLMDIAYPQSFGDGVNLQYVISNCIEHDKGIIHGKNSVIKHIIDGVEDTDAASIANVKREIQEYNAKVEKTLRKLGTALFHHIHGSGRSSTAGLTESNYLDWNKILT